MPQVVLLGPQLRHPTLLPVLEGLGAEGPFVAVTAGWVEREGETQALQDHMGREVEDLRLYARSEDLFARDPHFFRAYRGRRVLLRELQELYRIRLRHLMEADAELAQRAGSQALLAQERQHVLEALRALDAEHAARLRQVDEEFHARLGRSVALLEEHRAEVRERLAGARGVLIAGGHVAALLHRLRLFDVVAALRERLVVAWSAGAMAVCEQVVLFHDDPPHERGDPEAFGPGLGLCPDVVALPDASRRLRLGDPVRVARFARRFAPRRCTVLDDGAGLLFDGTAWRDVAEGARVLTTDGRVVGRNAA